MLEYSTYQLHRYGFLIFCNQAVLVDQDGVFQCDVFALRLSCTIYHSINTKKIHRLWILEWIILESVTTSLTVFDSFFGYFRWIIYCFNICRKTLGKCSKILLQFLTFFDLHQNCVFQTNSKNQQINPVTKWQRNSKTSIILFNHKNLITLLRVVYGKKSKK